MSFLASQAEGKKPASKTVILENNRTKLLGIKPTEEWTGVDDKSHDSELRDTQQV